MILVREISKSYGRVRAVRNVSLELPTGQVAGLLGPNGAGKTTTIRVITGVHPPDSGQVTVGGADIVTESARARRQIGYLPESAPLYPEMTPMGYLDYRGRLFGMDRRTRRRAAAQALERCRVGAMARRRIGALSKGYRQRVGLASAMLHDPPVLILDEPTNGLDPSQIRETRSLMRELAEDRTMLLCSHILPEIERTCDRVIVMAGGRVRADGSPEELTGGGARASRYTLELRANPSAPGDFSASRLEAVAGVSRVWPDPATLPDAHAGWRRLLVEARPGAGDLREALAGAAADAGLFVRELTTQRRSLEEVFIALVDEAGENGEVTP
ncbi:MAG: ABC transporter ATP-binding protein [Phycisphaerales bacterium JB059]